MPLNTLLRVILFAGFFLSAQWAVAQDFPSKPRVVVTTDPELDDSNSLARYLLYCTDFRTEGIIYASSQFHWKGDGKGTWHVAVCGSGQYPDQVTLSDAAALSTSFQGPEDAAPGNTIHLILEATDNGTPALTRYRRIILSVTP